MASKQFALFEDRFLESFTGSSIVKDHKVAIIEMIANSWDAAATRVDITWPDDDGEKFSIKDNEHGMTKEEFNKRYRTLSYDRSKELGHFANVPPDHKDLISKRLTFGKHGKGRFGGFAFGDTFYVRSWKNGKSVLYKVSKELSNTNPISFTEQVENTNVIGHGTEIFLDHSVKPYLKSEEVRKEIGMRFLTDPHFKVFLNDIEITFADIPEENISNFDIYVEDVGNIKITVIDVQSADKSTQQHGIAWHVKRRVVGDCT